MSPAVRLFRQRLERRAAALAPDLRRALLRGYDALQNARSDAELVRLIETGQLDQVLTARDLERALAPLQRAMRGGVESAAQAALKDLPRYASTGIFDVLNPLVIRSVQDLNFSLFTALSQTARDAVREFVQQALTAGQSPRMVARSLRDVIGLAPNQVQAVENFRRMLETGDAEALTRQLRDRRFDALLKKAVAGDGLSQPQIDRMVDAYRNRFLAFHAETVTRTAALSAQRLGQHLAWQDAVGRGDIDGDRLTKRWSGTLDDRERDSHLRLEGETVPWDQPFTNGLMYPGDMSGAPEEVFNCRCVMLYETRGTVKRGAGAFGVNLEQLKRVGLSERAA